MRGWWQQIVQDSHLSTTMQKMVLCMLWTEWSVPSQKHLLSFLRRIASSLYWDPVSYFNSAAFSNSYSQYHSLIKHICEIKIVYETSSFTSFLVVCIIKNMHFHWCTSSFCSALKDWSASDIEGTWSPDHFCSNRLCIWEAGSNSTVSITARRGMRWK